MKFSCTILHGAIYPLVADKVMLYFLISALEVSYCLEFFI